MDHIDLDLGDGKVHHIRISGITCQVRSPNLADSEWYERLLQKKSIVQSTALIQYLEKLGVPGESARALDQDQAKQLIDYITGVSQGK